MKTWTAGLSMILLTACAMGPDYIRPEVETPGSFRMAEKEGDPRSFANLPWWELLQDETLQKLIEIALQENKNLQIAAARVEEFQARLSAARIGFVPQINAAVNAPVARMNGARVPGAATPFNFSVQGELSWELDLWGRIRRANEAARADLLSLEESRRAVILGLVSGVAQAYFDLRQLDMQTEIAKRTLESWDESVKIARARLQQGMGSKLDADLFEAERAGAAARTAELERLTAQKEDELSVLLGRHPASIPRGAPLTEQVLPAEVPSGLPSELLQRRPDILAAEQALASATARIGVAKANRFPSLSLTGLLGVASPQLSNLLKDKSEFGVASAGLFAPLLNAQTLGFEQRAAEAQARQALLQYEQTILTAFREVEDSLAAIQTVRRQREAQEAQVASLRSALRLAELRYKGGISSYLDVLTAKRNLFESELALTTTQRFYLVSVVQLYKALGGGWPTAREAAADPVPS